jgi:conjugal transfer mating pair stabilization protein TraN
MADTGHFPGPGTLNLEVLTGTGSTYNVGGTRPDAAERTGVRSEGLDTDAARRAAEMERWGTALPVLP